MIPAFALLGALLVVPVGSAQASASDEAFVRDLVLLARQTPSDFSQICGQATGRYADAVSYAPTTSISGLNTTTQSLVRENGCFLDGKLVNGTRRFHGYGNFYDRVWFSNDWIRPPETSYNVEFHPAGSPDTIYGTLMITAT